MATVLVADDAAFQRLRVRKTLEAAGHTVIEASDGSTAVDAYASSRPDVTLLDITMPGMDGLEALRRIRAADPDARVAMITAMGQQSTVMEAIRHGARDFLVKPALPEAIIAMVAKIATG